MNRMNPHHPSRFGWKERTLSLALVGACLLPSQAADKKKVVVGFSQIGAESGWRTANTDSIKSEAAKRGVDR